MTTMFLVNCSGFKERTVTDLECRRLEISFSFNSDNYPWLLEKKYPQIAVWIKSETGDEQTLFVTQGAGKNDWYFADERPGSLPVWFGVKSKEEKLNLDAVSGATPGGDSHVIYWPVPESYHNKNVTVFLEANVSFDYNEFYTKEKDKPGFSDVNGQPSILWQVSFKIDGAPKGVTPEVIGHGHVLGENSNIDPDMSKITTALELFNYIHITYYPGR